MDLRETIFLNCKGTFKVAKTTVGSVLSVILCLIGTKSPNVFRKWNKNKLPTEVIHWAWILCKTQL